ncbi:MAG: cytochrome ubiquinol oxidase subunit I, partial [Pseudomonadota bacterium]|nr:cytochrome ubiquinol oxidase subunit I [Pseudomonadota bacterium]
MSGTQDRSSAEALTTLQKVWRNDPGIVGQLTAVNHSTIGLRFIATGFGFLLAGGMLAMFIRLQLAWPGNQVLDPERYSQFVT